MRKGTRIGATLLVAGLAAACGEGRAIFNVDVLSFMSDVDTIPYGPLPPATSISIPVPPKRLTALGTFGNSVVDSVRIMVAADLVNTSGAGNVAYEIYISPDSLTTYDAANLKFSLAGAVGPSPPDRTTVTADTTELVADPVFDRETIFVGIRVQATNTSASVLDGRLAFNGLNLRIVVRDDVF